MATTAAARREHPPGRRFPWAHPAAGILSCRAPCSHTLAQAARRRQRASDAAIVGGGGGVILLKRARTTMFALDRGVRVGLLERRSGRPGRRDRRRWASR